MIDLAHKEVLSFLALLAFGNVLSSTDHADGVSLVRGTLKIRKPVSLYPPDLAVCSQVPVLGRAGFRIGGIERRFYARPNPFYVIWMKHNAYLGRKPSCDRATFDRIRLALDSASPPSLSVIAKAAEASPSRRYSD